MTRPRDGAWATLRSLPRPVALVLVGVALNRAASFVQLFLVLYLVHLGFTPVQAGLALTMFGAGAVLGVLVGGAVTDRFGPRSTIGVSMATTGVLVGCLAFVRPYWALLAVCTGAGVAAQVFRPAASSLLAALTPASDLVMVSAAYRIALNVGATIGPLLGAFLATRSFTALFLTDMSTSLAFAATAFAWLPPRADHDSEAAGPPGSYAAVLHDGRYLLMVLSLLVIYVVEIQYASALPLALRGRGFSTAAYGIVIALNGLLVIAVQLPLTRAIQRWPIRRAVTLGIALIGVGIGMYGIRGALGFLIVATMVWTLGEIVAAPAVVAYPALIAPRSVRARYIATATAAQSIGYAIGPAVGTALLVRLGSGLWPLAAVAGLGAAVLAAAGIRQPEALLDAGQPAAAAAVTEPSPGPEDERPVRTAPAEEAAERR